MSNDSIIINGGKKLEGEVRISGSKNATVALIPAAVLASNVVTICDVPDISDVAALTTLLEELNISSIAIGIIAAAGSFTSSCASKKQEKNIFYAGRK